MPKVGDLTTLADGTIGKVSPIRNVKKTFAKPFPPTPSGEDLLPGSFNITPPS